MVKMKCPACSVPGGFVLVEKIEEFSLYACATCDVVFAWPMEVSRSYYEQHPDYERWETIEDMPLAWYHWNFISTVKRGGSLLDVGCATGNFLNKCRNAYSVFGIDFNRRLVEYGQKYGIPLFPLTVDELAERGLEKFDVITCFEVLEHQTDPEGFIRGILSLLKEDGLLVLSVPNRPVASLLLPKEMDSPPHHFLRWNERSLKRFLKKHNLSAEVRKRQFGNWVFTFERIIAKVIPRLRSKYRSAETSHQGKPAHLLRFLRKLLIVPAFLTYPLFLCFPAGGIQLFVVAKRSKA